MSGLNAELSLNYYIFRESGDDIFNIKIHSSNTVTELRSMIFLQNQDKFRGIHQLTLFQVDISEADFFVALSSAEDISNFPGAQKLKSLTRLSKIFDKQPSQENIHVLVTPPKEFHTQPRSVPGELGSLFELRSRYIRGFPTKHASPSPLAQPRNITNNFHGQFYYNRPPSGVSTLPVTLLHPIFNEFIDNCELCRPTADDYSFVRELADSMSRFYSSEEQRQKEFKDICQRYNLYFQSTKISGTRFETDADIRFQRFCGALGEIKDEVGMKGAEPVFQAACYFTTHLQQNEDMVNSYTAFPCIAFYLVGPILGFFGLALTDRTNIQILNPPIRLDYHHTDVKQCRIAARYLSAFRQTVRKLEQYYIEELPWLEQHPHLQRDPRYPCYYQYTSLADKKQYEINYTSQPFPEKLVYVGNNSAGKELCVKFTTRYSPEAHQVCATLGVAPTLHGFERLPGGWHMVIMEWMDKDYTTLVDNTLQSPLTSSNTLREMMDAFHAKGYVHGDVRDANVMIKRNGEDGFMLLDFDWSGPIGNTFYPMHVNKGPDLWRPEGVFDESEIRVEHDNAMLSRMLQDYGFKDDAEMYSD